MMRKKLIKIQCPNCGNVLGETSGNQGNIIIQCSECKKLVKYVWRTNETVITSRPGRDTSSGKRLY